MSGRCAVAWLVLVLGVALGGPPVMAQEPTTVEPPDEAPGGAPLVEDPPAADVLDGEGGSPQVFVVLSLLGSTTALAIMAVQWFRTRDR